MQLKVIFTYNGSGIAFHGEGWWSFSYDFAGNVAIFGFDNTSSFHTDNGKNNFLLLGEGPTDGINIALVQQKEKSSINFDKP